MSFNLVALTHLRAAIEIQTSDTSFATTPCGEDEERARLYQRRSLDYPNSDHNQ